MNLSSHIKAIIFDLDGLLMDSEPLWSHVDYKMLGKRGFKPNEEIKRRILGTGSKRTIEIYKEEFKLKETLEELMEEREKRFFELLDERIPPMEGVPKLIKALVRRKLKIAIATSGRHKTRMQRILKELGITEYISAIVTGEEIEKLKPAPDIFLSAAKKLSVNPANCLVFEDAPNGIEAAKAAGMMAYGVNSDDITRGLLKEKGADKVFSSLLEVKYENCTGT